ncbi:hypothetical protein JCM8202_004636 [Rhodotorula sphaerocarpa]
MPSRALPSTCNSDPAAEKQEPMPSAVTSGISLGLTRIHRLLSLLHAPQTRVPVVHIAGTNGKGSVSAYLSSILHRAGIPTARFNSPHLVDEWDCIHLHGRPVDEATYLAAKHEVERISREEDVGATSFEVLTATAFSLFARAKPPVRVAVVEVGMGGADDATNVVPAEQTLLSVVTAVDLDHQKFLGDTIAEIARVKAGIARAGGDLVVSCQSHADATEAIRAVAQERSARLHQAGQATLLPDQEVPVATPASPASSALASDLPPAPLASIPLSAEGTTPDSDGRAPAANLVARLPLPGSYQLQNAATAVLCASLLRTLTRPRALVPELATHVTDAAIREGVETTRWPGRLSWLTLPPPPPPSSSSTAANTSAPAHGERLVLLDGAHNPSSANLLAEYLGSLPERFRPRTLVFGLSSPRDPAEVVAPLLRALVGSSDAEAAPEKEGVEDGERYPPLKVVCCGFSPPAGMDWVRATTPAELAASVEAVVSKLSGPGSAGSAPQVSNPDSGAGLGPTRPPPPRVQVLVAQDAAEALSLCEVPPASEEEERGQVQEARPVVVAGSLYLVADVLRLVRARGGEV